ncbi:MAG: Gx transporter family protein [Eubacteriaceae bacterium]
MEITGIQNKTNSFSNVHRLVLTATFLGTALMLSLVESMIPPLPFVFPGVKLGLSNIVVMYALFFLSKSSAFSIAILKSGFIAFISGPVSGLLSLSGGLLSIFVMLIFLKSRSKNASYLIVSIFGAISHNIGQFLMISLIYTNLNLLVYLPVLIISGLIAGMITATILNILFPILKKLGLIREVEET